MKKTNSEWAKILEPEQFLIMREEGTEMPGSSDLNCIGCDQKLFSSEMKYDSGSGWPSFFQSFENVFETKTDHLQGYPRTEYHCIKCGGHHGHIFDDGPKPTGKRYCNNGKVLTFKEEK